MEDGKRRFQGKLSLYHKRGTRCMPGIVSGLRNQSFFIRNDKCGDAVSDNGSDGLRSL